MQRYSISQLPVVRDGELATLADVIGSLQDRDLLDRVFKNPDALHEDVATAMQPPLADGRRDAPRSTRSSPRSRAARTRSSSRCGGRPIGVVTRSDLLEYLAHTRAEQLRDTNWYASFGRPRSTRTTATSKRAALRRPCGDHRDSSARR